MNTARKHLAAVAAVLVLFAFGGCDKDGGFTSVDSETQVGELSEEESSTFCSDAVSHIDEQLTDERKTRLNCIFGATMAVGFADDDADPQSTCQEAFDECMNQEREDSPESEEIACPLDDAGDCSATVGEIEACTAAVTSSLVEKIDNFSCSDVSSDESQLVDKPEACAPLEEKCPELYSEMGPM